MDVRGLFFLLFLGLSVSAVNDAYITVDSGSTGLCYSLGSIDSPYCNGETFRVNGTSDSDIYIVNGYSRSMDINISKMGNQSVVDSFLNDTMVEPLYLALGMVGFLVFTVIFIGGGYIAIGFIASYIP